MKKIITLLLLLTVCLSMAACGLTDQKTDNGKTADPTSANRDRDAVASGDEAGTMTVGEFLETARGRKEAEAFKQNAEAGGNCTASCYAEGDTMVFEGRFTRELSDEELEAVYPAIEAYLNAEDTAEGMADILIGLRDCGVRSPKAKIVFSTVDGAVLGEKIYE